MSSMPPTAVSPLMALVTDISGECSALHAARFGRAPPAALGQPACGRGPEQRTREPCLLCMHCVLHHVSTQSFP